MIDVPVIHLTIRNLRLLLLPLTLAFHCDVASATPRNVLAGHLAASSRQVAFSVQEEHSIDLVVADVRSGSIAELRSSGTIAVPARFESAGFPKGLG